MLNTDKREVAKIERADSRVCALNIVSREREGGRSEDLNV